MDPVWSEIKSEMDREWVEHEAKTANFLAMNKRNI